MSDSRPRLSRVRMGVALVFCGLVAAGVTRAGEPAPAASGTFTVGKSSYRFADAVAFRTTRLQMSPGEPVTVVVLTPGPIDRQQVAAAVADNGNWTGSGHDVRFILRFDSKGKLVFGMFQGDARNIGLMRLQSVTSEVVVADSRASGRVALATPADFLGEPYTFEVSFQAEVVARN